MKKYLRQRIISSVLALSLIPLIVLFAVATDEKTARHAPNMYVDWVDNGDYDIMMIDWYCEQDAENTYWAVNNWDNGYAGFQNKDGKPVLLMSIWDDSDKKPIIEYGNGKTFGGEGTGSQIFTDYEWIKGKWYTMLVKVWTENGQSKYGQWVRDDNGKWLLCGIINYPEANRKFNKGSVFQEDFVFNNLSRTCRLKNAYGRFYNSEKWDSWDTYTIRSSYYAEGDSDGQWDINFNCNWGKASDGSYIWLQSGGGDFTNQIKILPFEGILSQPSTPKQGIIQLDNIVFTKDKSTATVSWKLADKSTPAFSYKLEFLDDFNNVVREEKCKTYDNDWSGLVDSRITSVRFIITDIFNKSYSQVVQPSILTTDVTAIPSPSTVIVNGNDVAFDAYNIDGSNYFKLRDLAMAFSKTNKKFEITWDESKNAINIISNNAYTTVGGELATGDGKINSISATTSKVYLDGNEISLTAYNINGNNYFKLRDLMQALDIYVGWDDATKTITLDTSKGYEA